MLGKFRNISSKRLIMKLEGLSISLYVFKLSIGEISKSTWCPVLELVCVFEKKVVLWMFWIGEEKKLVCKAHWYAIGLRYMMDFTRTFPNMFFSNPWRAFKSTSKFLPILFFCFLVELLKSVEMEKI